MGSQSQKTLASDCHLASSGFDYSFFKHERPQATVLTSDPMATIFQSMKLGGPVYPINLGRG